MTRHELITRKQEIEQELVTTKAAIHGNRRMPYADFQRLHRRRNALVHEKMQIDAALVQLKTTREPEATKQAQLRDEERITLMSLDMDGKRFWHAARGDHAEWLVDLIAAMGEDAPIVLTLTSITETQAKELPAAFWNLPEP
jgi:hypothetical protein